MAVIFGSNANFCQVSSSATVTTIKNGRTIKGEADWNVFNGLTYNLRLGFVHLHKLLVLIIVMFVYTVERNRK